MTESPGLALAHGLIARSIGVRMYDPIALESAREALNGKGAPRLSRSAAEALA